MVFVWIRMWTSNLVRLHWYCYRSLCSQKILIMAKKKKEVSKRPANFNVHELIHSLQGTCQTIDEVLLLMVDCEGMTENDLTEADHNAINSEIFRCEQCSWWYELADASTNEDYEGYCEGCGPDLEKDDRDN